MITNDCIPTSVLNFYIILYCRKRNMCNEKKHTILREATKSWLSLSENDKKIFTAKYNKSVAEYKQKIAENLKNMTPYLKKKHNNRSKRKNLTQNKNTVENNFEVTIIDSKLINSEVDPEKSIVSNLNVTNLQQIESGSELLNQPFITGHQSEPIPPILKSSKELFEMLRKNSKNKKTWETLSICEKRLYQNAVLSIKRRYIKSYQLFLGSLSPLELYNYYINNKEL